MNIKILLLLQIIFIGSACSLAEDIPENCTQFDGDKTACLQEGCIFQNNRPSWCIKEGVCNVDKNPIGVCYHSPENPNNGIVTSAYREGENLAISISSPGYLPLGENWKECGDDGDLSMAPEVCKCEAIGDEEELKAGSCN